MASEKRIQSEALIAVSALPDTLVWRNNTGTAWQGTPVRAAPGQTVVVRPGMIILTDARPISFGLKGSADIIGVSSGRALAIEVKDATGRQSEWQVKFAAAWKRAGGTYGLARSAAEAVALAKGG